MPERESAVDIEPTQSLPKADRARSPAAQRALAEAEERRRATAERAAAETATASPREVHGRGGAEPVRFGDWEINGRAIDF